MRNGVSENKLLNETFLVCAKIIGNKLMHKRCENEISALCKTISSLTVSDYLLQALDLIEYAYEPEYIDVILEYEFQKIDKSNLTLDELKTLVIINKSITRIVQKNDIDFFYNLYSHECSSAIRDTLSVILQYE